MKKLVITLSAFALAAAVNAATVTWGTGNIKLPGEGGAQTSTVGIDGNAGVTAYYYILDAAMAPGDVWSTYATQNPDTGVWTLKTPTERKSAFTAARSGGGGATTFTATGSKVDVDKDKSTYAAAIIWYDANGDTIINEGDWYIANSREYVNSSDKATTVPYLGLYSGTATTGTALAWQQVPGGTDPTPEPTTGLLMLVGLAGLALRRKQA